MQLVSGLLSGLSRATTIQETSAMAMTTGDHRVEIAREALGQKAGEFLPRR